MEILLLGVPGAGKTSLTQHLKGMHKPDIYIESAGESKQRILSELGILKSLHTMNQTESLLLNTLYFTWLTEHIDKFHPGFSDCWHKPILVIDTHATYGLPDGTIVNLLPNVYKADCVILLEARPDIIRERRIARGRNRDAVMKSFVEMELEAERSRTFAYTKKNNIPVLAIDNSDDWAYNDIVDFVTRQYQNWR